MILPRRIGSLLLVVAMLAAACTNSPSPADTPVNASANTESVKTPDPSRTPAIEDPAADEADDPIAISPPDPSADSSPTPESSPEPSAAPAPPVTEDATSLDGVSLEFGVVMKADAAPLALLTHPDGESLLVAEQNGVVHRWLPQPNGTYERVNPALVDFTDRVSDGSEQGLLGIALDPASDLLYLVYTDEDGTSRLVETTLDGANERELLVIAQPFENHNGGQLAFGPDGFLYIGLGDGGGGGDPTGTGQDTTDLLGSILRIAPNPGGETYAIPSDNPLIGTAGSRPEIWAFGLRNPWRFSFDETTGDLWIADVGQSSVEEIDFLPAAPNGTQAGAGANLGWPILEGTSILDGGDSSGTVEPIHQYGHDDGCSVTGGYVARGNHRALEGVYLFGDFCSNTVFGLIGAQTGEPVDVVPLGTVNGGLVSFGVGHNGELFAMLSSGEIHRITVQ